MAGISRRSRLDAERAALAADGKTAPRSTRRAKAKAAQTATPQRMNGEHRSSELPRAAGEAKTGDRDDGVRSRRPGA